MGLSKEPWYPGALSWHSTWCRWSTVNTSEEGLSVTRVFTVPQESLVPSRVGLDVTVGHAIGGG